MSNTMEFLKSLNKETIEEQVQENLDQVEETEEIQEEPQDLDTTEPVQEQPNDPEEVEEYFAPMYEEPEPLPQEVVQELIGHPTTEKVNYSLKEYVESNKESVRQYLEYTSMDLETMSDVDIIKYKLRKDNPNWSAEDISEELLDKYGIGLKTKVVSEEAFGDEVDKINEFNENIQKAISRGTRYLKTDVEKAKQEIREKIESLDLPQIEFDVTSNNPQEVIEKYTQQSIEEAQKFQEEVWIPNIKEQVSKLTGLQNKVEIEIKDGEKVFSEFNFRLTTNQKEELESYLSTYQAQPSDDKYVNQETGEPDLQRFVADKALERFAPAIIQAGIKEGIAKFKAEFTKNEMVNFTEEPRYTKQTPKGTQQKSVASGIFKASADAVYGTK